MFKKSGIAILVAAMAAGAYAQQPSEFNDEVTLGQTKQSKEIKDKKKLRVTGQIMMLKGNSFITKDINEITVEKTIFSEDNSSEVKIERVSGISG